MTKTQPAPPPDAARERGLDHPVDDSFPASDPPSTIPDPDEHTEPDAPPPPPPSTPQRRWTDARP